MERESFSLSGMLFFIVVVTAFLALGESVGWRVVGVAQLFFTIDVFRKKEVGVGVRGFKPSFYLKGNAAVFISVLSLAISIMLLLYPESTVMKWPAKR